MLLGENNEVLQDDNYIYEIKFDGIRALIYVSKSTFKIISRNGLDMTSKYPELASLQKIVGNHEVIFDGEIIATLNGLPSFSLLQKRNRVKNVGNKLQTEIPVIFIAFDILYDNKNVTKLSLIARKKLLEKYKDTDCFLKSRVYHDGLSLFKMVKKIGLEGIVEKKKTSTYEIGKRSCSWLKVKNIKGANFLVHGYLETSNTYSLLLGEYSKGDLNYVGKIRVNKKHKIINILKSLPKTNNQFVNFAEAAQFVQPTYKVRVRFLERTKSGRLRHAVIDE